MVLNPAMFGGLIRSVDDITSEMNRQRRAPPPELFGSVASPQAEDIGEVGSPPSGLTEIGSPTIGQRVNRDNKTDQLPGKPITDRLPQALTGEVMPPQGGGSIPAMPGQGLALPETRERRIKRDLAHALLMKGSAAQRVQGMQLLAEVNRPTKEELDVIERNRLLDVVGSADVDDDARERARIGVELGAHPKEVLEVLGFDATGQKASRERKEKLVADMVKGVSNRNAEIPVIRTAERIIRLAAPNDPFVTGLPGMGLQYLPRTDARQLVNEIGTLKAILGFDRLQQMRDESKTGGALGQVAVQELNFLQMVQGALDPFQKSAFLVNNVQDIVKGRQIINEMRSLTPLLDMGEPAAIERYDQLTQELTATIQEVDSRDGRVEDDYEMHNIPGKRDHVTRTPGYRATKKYSDDQMEGPVYGDPRSN